jgi:hypothetical protein
MSAHGDRGERGRLREKRHQARYWWRGLSGRRRGAVACHALLALGLLPAFIVGLVPSRLPALAPAPIGALVVLLVAGLLAEAREVQLPVGIGFEASTSIALVALFLWGPLLAFGLLSVFMVGKSAQVIRTGARRSDQLEAIETELWRMGTLANVGSGGWSMLAGGAVLQFARANPGAFQAGSLGGVFAATLTAGVAMSAAQLACGPLIHWPLWHEKAFGRTFQSVSGGVPVELLMVLLGALTAVIASRVGVLALGLLAPLVLSPLLIDDRARPASELSQAEATRNYAEALWVTLGLGPGARRRVTGAIRSLQQIRDSGLLADVEQSSLLDPLTLKELARAHHRDVYAAFAANEWWDGSGPAGIACDRLPALSQVLAVAEEWARLTCAGGPELSHEQALLQMGLLAGRRHDPAVLEAAARVLERERRLTPQPACQPRLHRRSRRLLLYLPQTVHQVGSD